MKTFRLLPFLLLGFSLAPAPHILAANDANGTPPVAGIDEHTRLVGEFVAERAKLIEARKSLKAQAKQARAENNPEALRTAQDEMVRLEREFATRNAALIRDLKAAEARNKPQPPNGKKSGG